ncbi:TRAM domain-containing protein [Halocatena halophila]|uniref:TRAM domain-containing protein n=1 Tax=Halocatena halophila TaxID=2814576 RepID=UPI002ED26202
MVEISEALRTVFTGTVEQRESSVVIEVPKAEITHGSITPGSVYRVALLATEETATPSDRPVGPEKTPPVAEGETRTVTVEAVGREGDGIAKVERGYVIIVPEGEPEEEVTIVVDRVTPTVAFASRVEETPSTTD